MGVHTMKRLVLSYVLLIVIGGIICDYDFITVSFDGVNMASE